MKTKQELVERTQEYEYFYDESSNGDIYDEETEHDIYTNVLTKNNERKQIPFINLLGRRCHPVHEYYERKKYEASLFWWTYRKDFPEIKPYCITSDTGWGCMLRSAQMMLSHALRIHFKSRHWKPEPSTLKAGEDDFIANLMIWFADFPSKTESVYSLHNMCAAGLAKYEVLPGEWYGPVTACYVMRDLVALHQQRQSNIFRVHVSSEGTVYNDSVFELMTKDAAAKKRISNNKQDEKHEHEEVVVEPLHPLDPVMIPPELAEMNLKDLEWDTSLLLLIPLRLGLDSFNEKYAQSVAQIFSLPQSVGILGGRPRGARWFYGAYADGSKILGLDPHTTQAAPKRKEDSTTTIDLTDDYLSSVHTAYPDILDLHRMDPSIALGFYCRDRNDFIDLQEALTTTTTTNPNHHPNSSSTSASASTTTTAPKLVSFVDKVPNYMSSASVNDMMLSDLDIDDGFDDDDDPEDGISDEDDYVLL